jgi:dihydroorotase
VATCIPQAFSQEPRFDLIVKGGRVIDPSRGFDAIRDVAIQGGRIAAVEPGILADAADVLDARGKLVVPGLIDIHTHAAASKDGPMLCLADGVTGLIDAGTRGAVRIAEIISIARTARQQCRILVNIGRNGLLPEGDTTDIENADVSAAREVIAMNRDYIVGVKARLSRDAAGSNDYETLRRAQQVATSFDLPVMIQIGQSVSSMARLLPLLKRGDVVTHMFAPPPNSIIDETGRILPEVIEARRRGVWFDVGNGRGAPFDGGSTAIGHLRWDIVERVLQQGFLPDTFSTDWSRAGRADQVIDFPNCLSKFLTFGMTLQEIIARATINPSRVFPAFKDRGTLSAGAPADVAVLDQRDGNFQFDDNFRNTRQGRQRLFPFATILDGKRI